MRISFHCLQGVVPVRAAVQHPDAFHRGPDADAQPQGEGGDPALHRGARPADGPGRLRQLQRDAPRRVAHHHLDHRTQELRRPQGTETEKETADYTFFNLTVGCDEIKSFTFKSFKNTINTFILTGLFKM